MSSRNTAPKSSPRRSAKTSDNNGNPSPHIRLLWLIAATVWALVAAAMISFNPADSLSHGVASASQHITNWIGPVGAATSLVIFQVFGSGAWLLLLSIGLYLGLLAFSGPISHVPLRAFGILMVAIGISAMHALLLPDVSSMPEGAGGLIAIAGVESLKARFGMLGTGMWVALFLMIGLTVAFDRWLVFVPRILGHVGRRVGETGIAGAGVIADKVRTARTAERAVTAVTNQQGEMVKSIFGAVARLHRRNTAGAYAGGGAAVLDHPENVEPDRPARPTRKPVEAVVPEPELDEEIEEVDELEEEIVEDESEEDTDVEDSAEDTDEHESEEEEDDEPRELSADDLRAKIAKLPVRFAGTDKRSASEQDLDELRALRASEEQVEKQYNFPGLDLLENPQENYSAELEAYVREQAEALEAALHQYGIKGEVVGIDSGPVVTLYQVRLAPGTKVSSITSVASDIARALRSVNIRVVANTEGMDTVGVEVPNRKKEKVRIKELMTTSEATAKMKLPLFLGKDASGAPLVIDLATLPHMLIAGTTGSGKSVCMNAIIMGFLYTQKPSDLKLVLVDPKMVELSQFKDIPHLMCPVVTDMNKAAAILEWAVTKMDERYELLAEAGCRDIAGYNSLGWDELKDRFQPQNELEEAKIPKKLPYMVFIIDELADLMMTNKEVESAIVRIAQKARAVGIHLILATQRPQANVVTGLIKSNMPGRLCFKVASGMDSRIVLDQKGGELLLGQGDMLLITPRSGTAARAQGTLVDDSEIRRVVKFVRDVSGPTFERSLVQLRGTGINQQMSPEDHEERMRQSAQEDPLFDKAVEIVLETQRGSVSLLQRRLAIGYTRASRLIELMGIAGIIGDHKGSVAREVIMTLEDWEAMKKIAAADASSSPSASTTTTQTSGRTAAPWETPEEDDTFDPGEEEPEPVAATKVVEPAKPVAAAPVPTAPAPSPVIEEEEEEEEVEEDGEEEAEDSVEVADDEETEEEESEDDDEYEYEYEYVEVDEEGNETVIEDEDSEDEAEDAPVIQAEVKPPATESKKN